MKHPRPKINISSARSTSRQSSFRQNVGRALLPTAVAAVVLVAIIVVPITVIHFALSNDWKSYILLKSQRFAEEPQPWWKVALKSYTHTLVHWDCQHLLGNLFSVLSYAPLVVVGRSSLKGVILIFVFYNLGGIVCGAVFFSNECGKLAGASASIDTLLGFWTVDLGHELLELLTIVRRGRWNDDNVATAILCCLAIVRIYNLGSILKYDLVGLIRGSDTYHKGHLIGMAVGFGIGCVSSFVSYCFPAAITYKSSLAKLIMSDNAPQVSEV